MLPAELRRTIELAFADVTLGDGVGLWEAQAIDNYEGADERLRARNQDQKLDWKKITDADLIRCHISLSFFDENGMRFHLPAFMLSEEFQESMYTFLLSYLIDMNDLVLSLFSSLTMGQRAAVRKYLIWCSNQKLYEDRKEEIEISLKEYWLEN